MASPSPGCSRISCAPRASSGLPVPRFQLQAVSPRRGPHGALKQLFPDKADLSDHIRGGLATPGLLPRKLCGLRQLRHVCRQLPLDALHIQLSRLSALCLAQAALRAQVQLEAVHCRQGGCSHAQALL